MNTHAPQDWPPSATIERLRLRSEIISRIRTYFQHRQVLEVETPLLSVATTTDPAMESLTTRVEPAEPATDGTRYLHTSPEFPMKRLLAAGSGPIYQICKVFRNGEQGRFHNPEFTMLEWYRPGYSADDLMDEVEDLLQIVLQGLVQIATAERCTYGELFQRYGNVDPFADDITLLQAKVRENGLQPPVDLGNDNPEPWRDLLLTHIIEPQLRQGLLFVTDFPASQAALARLRPEDPRIAERFELYMNGLELANGFHELSDGEEQRQRIDREIKERQRRGLPAVPVDQRYLAALDAGLPDCSGVALGVDRLIMLAAGANSLQEVISFPIDRA